MAKPLREGNLKFCLDMYQLLSSGEKNLFFSPYSISAVMSMVLLGSKENTAKQLKDGLGFEDVCESNIHTEIAKILTGVRSVKGNVVLNVANKLFPEASFKLESDFLENCQKFYDASVEGMDFIGNPEQSRVTINNWAHCETKDKIKNLLPSGSINSLTRLVLANAVYFKGDWMDKFEIKETRSRDFFVSPEKTVSVNMMFRSGKYNIGFDVGMNTQVVELPYNGNGVSMIIVLPVDKFGLAQVEKNVNPSWLLRMINQFLNEKIQLSLPRMKLEQEFDLVDTLKKVGITDVFNDSTANLKGLSPQEGLFVSKVAHKAYIEVNEEGSEAAAATAAVVMLRAAIRPVTVTCDHPFIFFLMHKPSQTMLFCGRFSSP